MRIIIENFDNQEREDNHYLNLYNSGAIDFMELRHKTKNPSSRFSEQHSTQSKKLKTFEEEAKITARYAPKPTTTVPVKKSSAAANTTKSKATPTNQHGTKTSSKPSVKN